MFQVGDKVALSSHNSLYSNVGTVEKISPKRGDITVNFKQCKMTFDSNGYEKTSGIWVYERKHIELLTPEITQFIYDRNDIMKCKNVFNWVYDNDKLTADQARRIMEILKENEE